MPAIVVYVNYLEQKNLKYLNKLCKQSFKNFDGELLIDLMLTVMLL